jgi:transposase-like protein
MARHRRFSFEFKRQVALDFLEQRMGLRELARKQRYSREVWK